MSTLASRYMRGWWKNPGNLTTEELQAKMAECTERANWHDQEERPLLARAARSKATIAGEELNRRLGVPV